LDRLVLVTSSSRPERRFFGGEALLRQFRSFSSLDGVPHFNFPSSFKRNSLFYFTFFILVI